MKKTQRYCSVPFVTFWRVHLVMKLIFIFLTLIYCHLANARTGESLKVRIDDGKIIGRYMTTISGRDIRAFMGIPYAAPPVDKLRFKAPQKPIPWFKNILYAHKEPPMCTQTNPFDSEMAKVVEGQEDCLYLNVYTPEVLIHYK